jgi:hypothetical protein
MSPRKDFTVHEPRVPAAACQNFGTFDKVEQQEFAKILKDIIFIERELENIRVETSLLPDFNLLDAFKLFDTRGIGNVSVQDII